MKWQRAAAHLFLGSVCPICGGKEGCNSGQPAIEQEMGGGGCCCCSCLLFGVNTLIVTTARIISTQTSKRSLQHPGSTHFHKNVTHKYNGRVSDLCVIIGHFHMNLSMHPARQRSRRIPCSGSQFSSIAKCVSTQQMYCSTGGIARYYYKAQQRLISHEVGSKVRFPHGDGAFGVRHNGGNAVALLSETRKGAAAAKPGNLSNPFEFVSRYFILP
jgi:hypothetical protein